MILPQNWFKLVKIHINWSPGVPMGIPMGSQGGLPIGRWSICSPPLPYTKKYPKTRFLTKSIKIIRKNAILTKFPKLRCPKGRSTALFACQKYNFVYFYVFFDRKIVIFWPFLPFLIKECPKMRFYRNFWKKCPKGQQIRKNVFLTSNKCGWASLRASEFLEFRQNGIFSVYFYRFW